MFNHSPLRYPGGKSRVSGFIAQLIKDNNIVEGTYVEPFAGGAGVALNLLFNGMVKDIYINDKDRSIYAFWKAITESTEDFINKIMEVNITIDEWEQQRKVQLNKNEANLFDLGFSTFFLNRTNRSGIIMGGVIGGKTQAGDWKLDVRFNKEKLISKILKIAEHKNNIIIQNKDAVDLLKTDVSTLDIKNTLIYLDPPYYKQGKKLYMNSFTHQQHVSLFEEINKMKHLWLVSYDDCQEIHDIYKSKRNITYPLRYTACIKYSGKEAMFASDNLLVDTKCNPLLCKKAC